MGSGRLLIGLLAIGFSAQLWMQQRGQQQQERALAQLSAALTSLSERPPPASPSLDLVALRRRANDVVDAAPRAPEVAAAAPVAKVTPQPEPPPRTYEQERSFDTARQIHGALLASGRVSQQELLRFRAELRASGATAEAEELTRQLVVEINNGRLTLEPGVSLF